MPAKSKSQQRLFCMALAVRKGDLKRSEVHQSVLDIVDSDMTDKQIKDFTTLDESTTVSLKEYVRESLNMPVMKNLQSIESYDDEDGNMVRYWMKIVNDDGNDEMVQVRLNDDTSLPLTMHQQVIIRGKHKDIPLTIKDIYREEGFVDVFLESYAYDTKYASGDQELSMPSAMKPEVFIVIKPGFFDRANDIITMFEKDGFKLLKTKPKWLTLSEARQLYISHKNEDFYDKLCKYMSSGKTYGIMFEFLKGSEKEALKRCDRLKDKIRKLWSESDMKNVMHSSDNVEDMYKESSIYF